MLQSVLGYSFLSCTRKYIFLSIGAKVFHISTAACVSDIFSEDCMFRDLIYFLFLKVSVDSNN
jgi:hypothetical protein